MFDPLDPGTCDGIGYRFQVPTIKFWISKNGKSVRNLEPLTPNKNSPGLFHLVSMNRKKGGFLDILPFTFAHQEFHGAGKRDPTVFLRFLASPNMKTPFDSDYLTKNETKKKELVIPWNQP